MIQQESVVKVADNSGAKKALVIGAISLSYAVMATGFYALVRIAL